MTKNKKILEIHNILMSMKNVAEKRQFTIDMKFHIFEAVKQVDLASSPIVETIKTEFEEYSKDLDEVYSSCGGTYDKERVMLILDVIAMPAAKIPDANLEKFTKEMEELGQKYSETFGRVKDLLDIEVEFAGIRKFKKEEFNDVSYFFIDPLMKLELVEA